MGIGPEGLLLWLRRRSVRTVPDAGLPNSRVTPRVLVVGGSNEDASSLSSCLEKRFGPENVSRATTIEAIERARVHTYEIVMCFDEIEDGSVLDAVRAIQHQCSTVPIVLLLAAPRRAAPSPRDAPPLWRSGPRSSLATARRLCGCP